MHLTCSKHYLEVNKTKTLGFVGAKYFDLTSIDGVG